MCIIILEGPDGSGKSTLGNNLSTEFGLKCFHSGKPTTQKEMDDRIDFIISLKDELWILDRAPWISEAVYSKCFNRPFLDTDRILEIWFKVPQLVIYCVPSFISPDQISTETKSHKSPDFLKRVKKNHQAIVQQYDEVINLIPAHIEVLRYDFTLPNAYDTIANRVREVIANDRRK